MAKQKPVVITITKTRRKTQPYTFSIDKPGAARKETKSEYYCSRGSARRGALRQLGAVKYNDIGWACDIRGRLHFIDFI